MSKLLTGTVEAGSSLPRPNHDVSQPSSRDLKSSQAPLLVPCCDLWAPFLLLRAEAELAYLQFQLLYGGPRGTLWWFECWLCPLPLQPQPKPEPQFCALSAMKKFNFPSYFYSYQTTLSPPLLVLRASYFLHVYLSLSSPFSLSPSLPAPTLETSNLQLETTLH